MMLVWANCSWHSSIFIPSYRELSGSTTTHNEMGPSRDKQEVQNVSGVSQLFWNILLYKHKREGGRESSRKHNKIKTSVKGSTRNRILETFKSIKEMEARNFAILHCPVCNKKGIQNLEIFHGQQRDFSHQLSVLFQAIGVCYFSSIRCRNTKEFTVWLALPAVIFSFYVNLPSKIWWA